MASENGCNPQPDGTSLPDADLVVEKNSLSAHRQSNSISQPDFSFPKSLRLKKRGDFLAIKKSGRKIVTPFLIAYIESSNSDSSLLGITVPKKVGNSPTRNYHKRLVREWFRLNKNSFNKAVVISVIILKELNKSDIFTKLDYIKRKIN